MLYGEVRRFYMEKLGKDKFIYNDMYMIILCLAYFKQHKKR